MIKAKRKGKLNTIMLNNQRFVLVPEDEYQRLTERGAPALPAKNSRGNFPAIAATEALIAQGLVSDRKAAKLSQRELARRAVIRVETLTRAERGAVVPDVRTLRKIDNALALVRPRRR
jgi:ribosome-binding protein aMBF1 (putative translation factor)